jgi:transposase
MDQLLMTQQERDRLVALKKAKKKLITQKQAASEIGVSERQIRRMLRNLKERGDRAVVHATRGRKSNRKLAAEVKQKVIEILSQEVPTWQKKQPSVALKLFLELLDEELPAIREKTRYLDR